jgi:ligand-binding sensor domain-containing protein
MKQVMFAIVRGPNGDMWFATYSGVSRFDGAIWKHYSIVEGERLEMLEEAGMLQTLALTVSPDGDVVAGGCGGIYRYEDGDWIDFWPADSDFILNFCIFPLAIGPEEELWIVPLDPQVNGYGVFHFNGDGWILYEEDTMTDFDIIEDIPEERTVTEGKFLSDDLVTSLATDPDGATWLVTGGDLMRFLDLTVRNG